MNFSFWWSLASDELASNELAYDDVITSGALCLQEHFLTSGTVLFRCLKASFLFISLLSFVLPEPIYDLKFFVYGPVHLNKY